MEAAGEGDLGDAVLRGLHRALGVADAQLHEIAVRRHAGDLAKRAPERPQRVAGALGDLLEAQVGRAVMAQVREQLENEAQSFGISVVDVRIRRADLPDQNSQAVYQRMQTERQRQAAEFRAQGSQHAQEIRAKADRDVTVLIAEAQSKGEQTRGDGDAERNRIFADAYGRDPNFFAFYRSMQAYETGLKGDTTRMVLSPNSSFFRYFNGASGTGEQAPTVLPAPSASAPAPK